MQTIEWSLWKIRFLANPAVFSDIVYSNVDGYIAANAFTTAPRHISNFGDVLIDPKTLQYTISVIDNCVNSGR